MASNRKNQICTLLKGIETGDPDSVLVVNEDKYIQHNPETHEGSEGLAELFKRLSKTSPRVNIVRVFEDSDYVFAHTEYDFENSNIGFEIFRFEDGQAVEHWDNIQRRAGPNQSGHSMVDGPTQAIDLDKTEPNRELVCSFVEDVVLTQASEKVENYIDEKDFIEHNPHNKDGLPVFGLVFDNTTKEVAEIQYQKMHRLLAEGSFGLSVCEGLNNGKQYSIFDLYRIADGKIVEHWDTIEAIPPRSEWKNENGKF